MKEALLAQEDTDGDGKITLADNGPKVDRLAHEHSEGH